MNEQHIRALSERKYLTVVELQPTTTGRWCYVAYHPEMPNCMSHGQTPGEAVCNLAEARQMVIAHLLENNLPVPEPKIIGAHTAIQKPVEFESEDVAITPPRVISSEASELQLQIA